MALSSNVLLSIPKKSSTSDLWINWHKQLVDAMGLQNANAYFMYDWQKNGNDDANSAELREYLKQNGLVLDSSNLIGALADFGYSVKDKVSSLLSIGTTGIVVVGGILVVGLAMIIYNVARNPVGAAQEATKLAIYKGL